MEKKDFLNYIHYFRGLAILLIVGLHAAVTLNWEDALLQRKFLIVLFNNGTVLFVFIAGFLFYHLHKDRFDYGDYLKKKFLHVIIPYLIISVPALIDKFYFDKIGDHWWMDRGFSENGPVFKVFFLLITGRHMGVFWFIPMISIVYLLGPLILRFARSTSFMYIVPALTFLTLYTFRFGYYANILLSLQYFFPIYLFGIWVYKVKDFFFAHARTVVIVLGLIYLGISIGEMLEWLPFDETIGLRDVKYTVYRFNYNKLKMVLFTVWALSGFYLLNHVKMPVLKRLGDYSFGIFFVHLYVIQVFRLLDRARYLPISPPNILTFFLYYGVVVLLTVMIVKLVRMSFRDYSRYVIGS
jgi:probable poly-beta-1,6-N-acetyl-D-glucosamine export protein